MKYPRLSRFTLHVSRWVPIITFILIATLFNSQSHAQVVEIPDPNLETAIREALKLPEHLPITQQEMATLAELSAWKKGITDLTGLEHATNLQVASLVRNQIRDITPIAKLIHLRLLALDGNPVSDISPIANLTNLEHLRLSGDPQIRDITPLANLIRLEKLSLNNQAVDDITPLANLTRLEELRLSSNVVTDITPLANLTLLKILHLNNNLIADITPIITLTNLKELRLADNPIDDFSPLAVLEDVELDIEVDLSQFNPLDLVVAVPDTNLKRAIRATLALTETEPLTRRQMLHLLELDAQNKGLTNLTGLEYATELTELRLCDNQIHDLRPLEGLVRLDALTLCANLLSDISPLAGLTQLRVLDLKDNMIEDITPLANLTLLEELRLERNAIPSIEPLVGLTNLKKLRLVDNPIGDFSPLLELQDVELDIEVDTSESDLLNGVNIPDPNLRAAIRDTLQLPTGQPITKQEMLLLTRLPGKFAWKRGITDLTGLEHATFLDHLSLRSNLIQDLTPIAELIHLELLTLNQNPVADLTPLSKLVNLKTLDFTRCRYITDISPLRNLVNLEELFIQQTAVVDFSPIQRLNLIEFHYDETCESPPLLPSPRERIESRTFPSILQAWDDAIGPNHLTAEQRNVLHDLHWHPRFETIQWDITPDASTTGVATTLTGDLDHAHEVRQRRLNQNPNMIFLGGAANTAHPTVDRFPPDSDLWLRDANGEILRKPDGKLLIDFVKPEFQDLFIKQIVAFDRCGLYDGVMIDEFANNGTGFSGRHFYPYTDEEIIQAYTNIFQAIRSQVSDDFLIIINANHTKPTRYAEFINGIFMETGKDYPGGYSRPWLITLEETLSWAEDKLKEPRINSLEGEGMSIEPPDGPNNLRWMRLFTTLSLTHSDGYVIYTTGFRDLGESHPDHDHLWHSFWDADLGRPIGPKAQYHQTIEGLFIREFTNGWAVYNRSHKAQTITLPAPATPVSDRENNAASQTHLLPDLDGEIYLKVKNPADVNNDGNVNILDLVHLANNFGKSDPDLNNDGVVNILDLVFVVQQLSQ